mmetsp:Transcript_2378/g.15937  ORF Transcript_2378/g.15937 Transcript_2378/m.15937 type:complete len:315 (-) Transcript_2378:2027-2971(-)
MPCQEIPMLHRWREQQVSSTTTQRLRREAMDLPATAAPSFIPQRTVRRRTPASSWMESPVEIHVHHSHSLACTSTSHVRRHSSVRQGARCDLRRQHSFRRTRRPSSTWFRSNVVARTCITPSSQPATQLMRSARRPSRAHVPRTRAARTSNDLSNADAEAKLLATIARGVELLPVRKCACVVHGHGLAHLGLGGAVAGANHLARDAHDVVCTVLHVCWAGWDVDLRGSVRTSGRTTSHITRKDLGSRRIWPRDTRACLPVRVTRPTRNMGCSGHPNPTRGAASASTPCDPGAPRRCGTSEKDRPLLWQGCVPGW